MKTDKERLERLASKRDIFGRRTVEHLVREYEDALRRAREAHRAVLDAIAARNAAPDGVMKRARELLLTDEKKFADWREEEVAEAYALLALAVPDEEESRRHTDAKRQQDRGTGDEFNAMAHEGGE